MITATNICHSLPYLQDVGISFTPGQMTGIIGPNGAGKTTLLKILAGLIKPETGTITLDDKPLHELPHSERAIKMAYLEQHAFVHWPLTVRQLVELGRFPHRLNPHNSPARDRNVVERVIEQMGIQDLSGRQFDTLSGGERARAIIARALAVEAEYLLVDEPIVSLDLNFQIDVMARLAHQAKNGTAVGVILHDLNLASAYCHRLYLLNQGKLVAHGLAADVLTQDRLKSIFGIDASINRRNGNIEINPVLPEIS